MSYYLEVLQEYATFSGRIRRKKFWLFTLVSFIISLVISAVLPPLSLLYGLAVLLPSLGAAIRRLHDTGRSGAWVLISFIPVIGLVLLVFLAQDSEAGANQYGPHPKVNEGRFNTPQQQQLNSNAAGQEHIPGLEQSQQETKIECRECGTEINSKLNFCPECGSEILPAKKQKCSNCESLVASEAKFCPECGTNLS